METAARNAQDLEIDRIVREVWKYYDDEANEKAGSVRRWLAQFDDDERASMLELIRHLRIFKPYDCWKALEWFAETIRSHFRGDLNGVYFCPLSDRPSSSGSQFGYELRKVLKVPIESFIFENPMDDLPADARALVFFDDIIGSGNQAIKFYTKHIAPHVDGQELLYCVIAGFEHGIRKVEKETKMRVLCHKKFGAAQRIFGSKSPLGQSREKCQKIARKYGARLYPKGSLGYDRTQAMIAFYYTCPNNTLPIIWAGPGSGSAEQESWVPLFKRSETLELKPAARDRVEPKRAEQAIEQFYQLLSEKLYVDAFALLSRRLRRTKYADNSARFESGFANTISLLPLARMRLKGGPRRQKWLVHYPERVHILRHKELDGLGRMRLEDIGRLEKGMDALKQVLRDDLLASTESVSTIPLSYFFSVNAIEESLWHCNIPFEEARSKFDVEEQDLIRTKMVTCIKEDGTWRIDHLHSILPGAQPAIEDDPI